MERLIEKEKDEKNCDALVSTIYLIKRKRSNWEISTLSLP